MIKIDENFYINYISVEKEEKTVKKVESKTNHIFVCDVSGSMYYELPLIKKQLKNKLSSIMKEGDTISIIWFSGNNQAGILKEEVEVKSLTTLSNLHDAIDKWLKPIGLTAFLKPLELVKDVVKRIKNNRTDSNFSLIFLSDGYNNDCPWNDVVTTLEKDIIFSTFIEYGFYADSVKLTQMASILGGEKISCDNFEDFEPVFNSKISSTIKGNKKISVHIDDEYLYDFAFSVNEEDGSIAVYNIANREILVSSDVEKIYYFSYKDNETNNQRNDENSILYAGIYILSDQLKYDEAERIFYALGDNYMYKKLMNAYGKQKLNTFKKEIKECIFDSEKRFLEGEKHIRRVPDNVYCLIDLFNDLEYLNAKFITNHPKFVYNRIGRKNVVKDVTDEDREKLSKSESFDDINEVMDDIKSRHVKFESFTEIFPLNDLVWNNERANLSIRTRENGRVILPKDNKFKMSGIDSFRYRNYTFIKDGILNVKYLPVSTFENNKKLEFILIENNIQYSYDSFFGFFIIDLSSLPIINRQMIKSLYAKDLGLLEWSLIKIQAEKKVYDYYKNKYFPKKSESFVEKYGEECAEWLKELGITDYNGFNPKTIKEESTDYYMSVVLNTKIKSFSSLPSVNAVIKKIDSGKKMTPSEALMNKTIEKIKGELLNVHEKNEEGLKEYFETNSKRVNDVRKFLLMNIAKIKFSLILSKKWFNEFKDFDENTLDLELDEEILTITFDLTEKLEKI